MNTTAILFVSISTTLDLLGSGKLQPEHVDTGLFAYTGGWERIHRHRRSWAGQMAQDSMPGVEPSFAAKRRALNIFNRFIDIIKEAEHAGRVAWVSDYEYLAPVRELLERNGVNHWPESDDIMPDGYSPWGYLQELLDRCRTGLALDFNRNRIAHLFDA